MGPAFHKHILKLSKKRLLAKVHPPATDSRPLEVQHPTPNVDNLISRAPEKSPIWVASAQVRLPPLPMIFQACLEETANLESHRDCKSSKVLIERYYPRLTLDFETNKRVCDEIAIIASKRLRNKIAGYTTHLMKRIQRGPVRGISFKLQEEERERKDQYVPEVSALDFAQTSESGQLDIDTETKDLLKHLGFDSIPVNVVPVTQSQGTERPRRFGDRPPRS
ncbi:hypothetical protein SUNI508_04839 [Seiridium unicorne]|uniref:40S ribosomal protein S17 n=1 Tax=Seiridium unicorne TaxID=138068 RepID=A0ABR2V6F3_9PEZI